MRRWYNVIAVRKFTRSSRAWNSSDRERSVAVEKRRCCSRESLRENRWILQVFLPRFLLDLNCIFCSKFSNNSILVDLLHRCIRALRQHWSASTWAARSFRRSRTDEVSCVCLHPNRNVTADSTSSPQRRNRIFPSKRTPEWIVEETSRVRIRWDASLQEICERTSRLAA